jgi:hypothetical protein
MPRPTWSIFWNSVPPVPERAAGRRWRVEPASSVTVGSRSACWMRYCARTLATLSTATRRSRLFARACAISAWSCGSTKKSRQPRSLAAVPAAGASDAAFQ